MGFKQSLRKRRQLFTAFWGFLALLKTEQQHHSIHMCTNILEMFVFFLLALGGFRETTFVYKIIFFFFQMFLQLISLCSCFIPSFFFFFLLLFIYFSAFLSFLFLFEKNVIIKVPCFYLFYVKLPQQTWLPQGQYPDPYPPLHIFQSDCLVTC